MLNYKYVAMALLIWVGVLVELVVGLIKLAEGLQGAEGPTEHLVDFAVLLVLQFMNAFVGWHEECKAGDAVAALKQSLVEAHQTLTVQGRKE